MFCWNCGNEIGNSRFCPCCGVAQVPTQTSASKTGKDSHVLLAVVCAVVGGILLLGMMLVGALLLLAGGREKHEPQIQTPVVTEAPAPTVKPTEAPKPTEPAKVEDVVQKKEETIDEYDHVLPDLASFLDTKYTQDEWGYTHYVTCLIDKDDEDAIVEAVVDLLKEPKYQLMQMGKDTTTENSKKCINYTFMYTGKNQDVDWVYLKSGGKYHVKLTQMDYSSSQTALILYTHPEFYLKDPGVTWKDWDADPASISADTDPEPAPTPSAGETIKVRGDTTVYLKSGSAVELVCTYDENAGYDVYEWSITSGSDIISINKERGKGCTVTGLSAGKAKIKMVYKYGVTGPNVLTGLPEPQQKSKTSTYTIVVE